MPDSAFKQIQQDYYPAWFRFHPEAALDAGVQGYQHQLRPYSDQDQVALLALNEKLLGALDEVNQSELDSDERLDLELMRGAAFLEIEEALEFDWRVRDPEVYLPLHAIYQLIIRDPDDFAGALRQRLTDLPGYLRDARGYIGRQPERIPPRWLDSAVIAAETGMMFLRDLPAQQKVKAHGEMLKDLGSLTESAIQALGHYAQFLQTGIGGRASGDIAVGRKRFEHLLRHRHFLPVAARDLHTFGWHLFERTEADIRDVCRRITGGDDVAALAEAIRAGQPPAEHLLDSYRQQMKAARTFSRASGLLSFPQAECLTVMATPVFLRHRIPFAAYEPAAPSDPEQRGRYLVTPPRDESESFKHNRLAVMHTCVHEAYPGHHVQFAVANLRPESSTLPRLLNKSATMYEGWALYCEQLMFEQGFLDHPQNEFLLLKDRLWRALRVVVDTGMHTGGQSLEQAARMMMDRLGFSHSQAQGEATWYSRSPVVPLGYATGWAMVNAARRLAGACASREDLKAFHDRLLGHGSIALPLVLQRAFGEDLKKQVLAEALG